MTKRREWLAVHSGRKPLPPGLGIIVVIPLRGDLMATEKLPKTAKKRETTAEFVERTNKQDVKRNGLRVRYGFTKRVR
jgi:hypothetical protein